MANRERGEVVGQVGSRSLTLVVDTTAMCEIEALLSTPTRDYSYRTDMFPQMGRMRVTAVRAFLWGATRRHHPELTLREIGVLMDEAGGLDPLYPLLKEVAGLGEPGPADQLPAAEAGTSARPRKAQVGAGGTSTSKRGASA
jgi:hypothetical protein